MNCNSQEFAVPILFCPSAQLGHQWGPGRGEQRGVAGSSLALCVCIEDQIRCPGTVSSPYPGAEKGLFVCDLGLWHQRDKECSLCEDRGGGSRGFGITGCGAPGSLSPPSSWALITGNTDVAQAASMGRDRREWEEPCHLTGSVCTCFRFKNTFTQQVASIKHNYFYLL